MTNKYTLCVVGPDDGIDEYEFTDQRGYATVKAEILSLLHGGEGWLDLGRSLVNVSVISDLAKSVYLENGWLTEVGTDDAEPLLPEEEAA
jgi:hypothetical protein